MTRLLAFFWTFVCVNAFAVAPPIRLLPSATHASYDTKQVLASLRALYDGADYREIRVQPVHDGETPDHLLVYLMPRGKHRVDFASVAIDPDFHFRSVEEQYTLRAADHSAQPLDRAVSCPDPTVQFISFCPNNDQLEESTTHEVTVAAQAAGLKTVELLVNQATRQNYLNYLSCPRLVGDFYDGDANPQAITTYDGELSASDVISSLSGKFKYWVTNIWVACEAFNNPMLGAMIDTAQSKKYAAGINDLNVGPSDKAAACAMKAALAGQPILASFQDCVSQNDVASDHWGIDGNGPDLFQWNPPPQDP